MDFNKNKPKELNSIEHSEKAASGDRQMSEIHDAPSKLQTTEISPQKEFEYSVEQRLLKSNFIINEDESHFFSKEVLDYKDFATIYRKSKSPFNRFEIHKFAKKIKGLDNFVVLCCSKLHKKFFGAKIVYDTKSNKTDINRCFLFSLSNRLKYRVLKTTNISQLTQIFSNQLNMGSTDKPSATRRKLDEYIFFVDEGENPKVHFGHTDLIIADQPYYSKSSSRLGNIFYNKRVGNNEEELAGSGEFEIDNIIVFTISGK